MEIKKSIVYLHWIQNETNAPGRFSDKKQKIMKTTDVNETLIGKKVSFMCRGFKAIGTVTSIIEDKYCKGLDIELESDVYDGFERVKHAHSSGRKGDNFGNLLSVELI